MKRLKFRASSGKEKTSFRRVGDLNCNMLTQNNLSKQIHDLSDNMHLSQLIRTPTRITVNSTTLIDLILVSNNLKSLESGTRSIGLSDHLLIYLVLKEKTTAPLYVL